jgi:hypothetical protein
MKLVWRSPKFFKHGGIWLYVMKKWYRIIPVKEFECHN